jgi:peptidoglycan/LPS O-acetylase OafA/YrhL
LLALPVLALALSTVMMLGFGRSSVLLTYLPVFFVGIAFARRDRGEAQVWLVPAMVALAAISLFAFASHRNWPAGFFLLANAGLFHIVRWQRFSIGWLARLGVISYSVYLYHTTLGFPLLELGLGASSSEIWPGVMLAVLAIVLAVSVLSYRLVEVPALALVRQGFSRIQAQPPSTM